MGQQGRDWLPSMETLSAGIAVAVYGPGHGALCGLSAARVHGAMPRAIATGQVLGPRQHQPIELLVRPRRVEFRRRDPDRLDLELWNTEIGPALVTSIDQTILDLSGSPFPDPAAPRAEAVRALMGMTTPERMADLALRVRGRSAWRRARTLVDHAQ